MRRLRTASVVGLLLTALACSDRACGGRGGLPPTGLKTVKRGDGRSYHFLDKGAWKGYYDAQGRLALAEYDSSGDGRADYIAHYDEARRIRLIEVDEDQDGWVDRFEYYDARGVLEKIGRCRKQRGRADVWTFRGPDGHASRVEHDDDGDGKPDRADVLDHGLVVRTEIDSDHDGRMDRWQTLKAGHLVSEDIDTDRDGKPDRRLIFDARGRVVRMERLPR